MNNESMEIRVDEGATVRQVLDVGTTREGKVVGIEGVDPSRCRGFVCGGNEWAFRTTKFTIRFEGEDDLVITGDAFLPTRQGAPIFEVTRLGSTLGRL